MLKITMIVATGRAHAPLAKFNASSAQVRDGALELSIPTQAQQTIARGKLTQHRVRYTSEGSEISIDLASTMIRFDIAAA